jgi:hypothetical protein
MARPELTFILLTPDNFETVRKTVACVARDSRSRVVELLIVTENAEELNADPGVIEEFHSLQVLRTPMSSGSGAARAAAVRAASAPIVVFGEDHCFPQEGWIDALVGAYAEPYAAVGPVVMNANPSNLVSWADLLMGYGPWLAPGRSTETEHLPGHNSSYRKDVLLTIDEDLPEMFEAESAMHWRLRSLGHRLFQESSACVAHTNFDQWSVWLPVSYHAGRVFADTRALEWSRAHRMGFAIASPLVPFVRLWRHLRQAIEAGLPLSLVARVAPVLTIGLIANAAGQCIGAAAGPGNSRATLVEWDFHRNVPRERVTA